MKHDAAYSRRHRMVVKYRGKAAEHTCSCGKPAREWATIHGKDGLSPEDYMPMCSSCHRHYDKPKVPRKRTEEEKKNLSEKMKGRKLSPETRAKLQVHWDARRGVPRLPEVVEKMRSKAMGHPVSDETKRKISEAMKKRNTQLIRK